MLAIALEVRPHQVTLVPERPDEVTTEGGLDLLSRADAVRAAAERLAAADVRVSLFLDPDEAQIDALAGMESESVRGFEINTDRYTRGDAAAAGELASIAAAATFGRERGLAVYAGHGLTTANVAPVAAIPEIEELNIGHSIVSRAVLVGMAAAVREMLQALDV
jgi:pyridoxine 5-phosphate synthase